MKQSIKHTILLPLILLVISFSLNAVSAKNSDIPAATLLRKAEMAYQSAKYAMAADYFETYLRNPSNSNNKVLPLLADCYWQMRQCDKALHVYELLYPKFEYCRSEQELMRISELLARQERYEQASECLIRIPAYKEKAMTYLNKFKINEMRKDSLCWKLGFININTNFREFSPFVADSILFFSSNKPFGQQTEASGWDKSNYARLWAIPFMQIKSTPLAEMKQNMIKKTIVEVGKKNNVKSFEMGDNQKKQDLLRETDTKIYLGADKKTIGTVVQGLEKFHYNAGAVSVDKYKHIYFSANYDVPDQNGVNRIRLMEGLYTPNGVINIKALPFGNPNEYSVMHPTVNPEGTLLICASNKKMPHNTFDLYYTQRKDLNQPWDSLKILGNNINTYGNEVFPYISKDEFLYFSSDFLPGLGGLDIYRLQLRDALSGQEIAEHIGYPVSSPADDFGYAQQDKDGSRGYFTSDRMNNDDNLYSFKYTPLIIEPKKSFIEGFVVEKATQMPVDNATVFLYNKTVDTVYIAKTDAKGKYRFPHQTTSSVIIKAIEKKFNNDDCLAAKFKYEARPKDTIQRAPRKLELDIYRVGYTWRLSNIHYDFDKWNIRADAAPILDSLVAKLNEQPIKVELGSHTDSRGTFKYNERLSQRRAESAVNYLITHGIDASRITARGYGEYQLLNRCKDKVKCKDSEHQVNRRTEVKVTGYTIVQKKTYQVDGDKFKNNQKVNKKDLPVGFFDDCE